MKETPEFEVRGRRVLLIGPEVPPYGGMAIQGQLMHDLMKREGIVTGFLASNLPFPRPVRFLDRIRGLRPFLRSIWFSCRLWALLPKFEIVHILACSWLYFFLIVCPAVAMSKMRGKRVILNYRGGEADAFFRRSAPFLRPFFRMAHVVTAPSQFLVNVIGHHMRVNVKIVPNIVNFDRFRYRERSPLRPHMIVTRHLLKLYDIESVIRAFGLVQGVHPDATLLVVGTGDQEAYLKALVVELALRDVSFMGYVPQKDLPALYEQCDILLNASRADNFPGSLVEAAAAGLAVVTTAAGGIPYIFENGKSALMVKLGDWQGLGEAALRILADAELANRITHEAVEQCRKYDWKNVRRQLYRIYGFPQAAGAPAVGEESFAGAVSTVAGF